MMNLIGVLVAMLASLLAVIFVYPRVVSFAMKRRIVDNPDARKLQRNPVPVMGGVAVFFGLAVGLFAVGIYDVSMPLILDALACEVQFEPLNVVGILPMFLAMSIMLGVGIADDVSGLSPRLRFIIEIAMTVMLIFWTKTSLNDFQGLWGVDMVPLWVSVPLTIVAVVGVINAINLVDGVDGLSSGYCIMASAAFGILFYFTGDYLVLMLCSLSVDSLLPFFFHNVFGKKSKMFIGDGGSLMMGVVMSTYVVSAIASGSGSEKLVANGFGVVPFTLAVMCVPVFDTVRVMIMRILRGTSPFHPDKTHLHHLFIELGYSHFGTTISELLLNIMVIMAWYLTYKLGASIDVQFYVVIGVGLLLTAGFYKFVKVNQVRNTAIFRLLQSFGKKTHFEECSGWLRLQEIVDFK
ncbi:MAG: undecaprenyl/decaprenyl-phosphate alpha-N-acetylglucosaminyl 1-phosphate transferase [Alistipes sp.]|nr:undecaprenyl/decaprenyl-phosphate alpha-N-acetylglucosaminyl 1-phosphate transferase [Alistipes sp.]